MTRTTKIITTINGVEYDADDYSNNVYDLIIQSYELVQTLPDVESISIEVQDLQGAIKSYTFNKDKSNVTVQPEGLELSLVE